jgi:peptidyl-prolyl cis-trans isomerase A (cyclophilin A)
MTTKNEWAAVSTFATLTRQAVAALCVAGAAWSGQASAANTVVQFDTSLGSFQVSLEDDTTPVTVANFLDYVQKQAYANTVVHRSVPDFVVQGGGFYTDFSSVASSAPIVNESSLPNARGTIAMARTADLNSATSQWFINTVDNAFLDTAQYAVFGHVLGDGMQVVDAIAALPIYNLASFAGQTFTEVPLRNVGTANVFSPDFFVTTSIAVVPEPQTWMLMGLGLVGIGPVARRTRRA